MMLSLTEPAVPTTTTPHICAPINSCNLYCPYGLRVDIYGCTSCECFPPPFVPTTLPPTTTTPTERLTTTRRTPNGKIRHEWYHRILICGEILPLLLRDFYLHMIYLCWLKTSFLAFPWIAGYFTHCCVKPSFNILHMCLGLVVIAHALVPCIMCCHHSTTSSVVLSCSLLSLAAILLVSWSILSSVLGRCPAHFDLDALMENPFNIFHLSLYR